MEAKQVPLIELLERVPKDARLEVNDGPYSTSYYPVGRNCHDAAAELRRQHELLREARDALEELLYAWNDKSESKAVPVLARLDAALGDKCKHCAGLGYDSSGL